MTQTMRAAWMQNGRVWVDETSVPDPGPGEVLVKSRACGICGSDLHAITHTQDFIATSREAGGAFKLTTEAPVVLGHEFCAEVVSYGAQTQGTISPGELVCSVPMLMRQRPLAIGYSDETPGGFAQYMLLSESLLLPVPAGTSATAAAMTEPLAVGYHAVNRAKLQAEDEVVVVGCGPVGLAVLAALQASRRSGAQSPQRVIAADYSPGRRQMAAALGADDVVDPAVTEALRHPLLRRRNTVVFECVGVPGLLDQLCLQAPQNTRIVVVGVCLQTDQFRPLIAINKELNFQFVLGYTAEEFSTTLQLIAEGVFEVTQMVSHEIGLDEVYDATRSLATPDQYGKVIVKPWH